MGRVWNLLAQKVVEYSVDPDAERKHVGAVGAVELIHAVKPCGVRRNVQLRTGVGVEDVKAFIEIRAHPDELVANLRIFMVTVRRNGIARIVIDDKDSSDSSEGKRLDEIHDRLELCRCFGSVPQLRVVEIQIIVSSPRPGLRQPYFTNAGLIRGRLIEAVKIEKIAVFPVLNVLLNSGRYETVERF